LKSFNEILNEHRKKQIEEGVYAEDVGGTVPEKSFDKVYSEYLAAQNPISEQQSAQSFFNDAQTVLDRFQYEYDNPKADTVKGYNKAFDSLQKDSESARKYIESLYGTENYDSTMSAFEKYNKAIADSKKLLNSDEGTKHINYLLSDEGKAAKKAATQQAAVDEYSKTVNTENFSGAKQVAEKYGMTEDELKKSYLDYSLSTAAGEVLNGKGSVKDVASKYNLAEKELSKTVDDTKLAGKYLDLENKYSDLSYKDMVALLKNPEYRGEDIYRSVNRYINNFGATSNPNDFRNGLTDEDVVVLKDPKGEAHEHAYKAVAEDFGMSEEDVKRVYNDYNSAQGYSSNLGYKSRQLSDDDKNYLNYKIIQNADADQLQSVQDSLPKNIQNEFSDLNAQINVVMPRKQEKKFYLDVNEAVPDAEKLYNEIVSLENKDVSPEEKPDNDATIELKKEAFNDKLKEAMGDSQFNFDNYHKYRERYNEHQATVKQNEAWKEFNETPVGGAVGNVARPFINMFGSIADAARYGGAQIDKLFGGDGYIDPESTANYTAQIVTDVTSKKINEATRDNYALNYFANLGYSTATSMTDMALAAGVNMIPYVGTAASSAMFFSSAGVSKANEVLENGGTLEQATASMVAAGSAELLFERISLNKLESFQLHGDYDSARKYFKNLGKQAFVEGSEEFVTTLADTFADELINGDRSSFNLSKKKYMEQGLSESEATNKAMNDWGSDIIADALGGAISGGAMGAVQGGAQLHKVNKDSTELGGEAISSKDFDLNLLVEQGKKSNFPEAVKLANSIDKQIASYNNSQKADNSKGEEKNAKAKSLEETIGFKNIGRLMRLVQTDADMQRRSEEKAVSDNLDDSEKAIVSKIQKGSVLSKNDIQTIKESAYLTKAISTFTDTTADKVIKSVDFNESRPNKNNFKVSSKEGVTLVNNKEFNGGIEIESVDTRKGLITYNLNHANGKTEQLTSKNIKFASSTEALLHEQAASYNTEQARAFVDSYKEGQDVNKYAREWNLYSNYGRLATNLSPERMNLGGTLTNEQKITAYEMGLNSRVAANQLKTIIDSDNEIKPYTSQNQGSFVNNIPSGTKLTFEQNQMKNFLRDMSVVTGLNIEVFQSKTDKHGNFIGENGSFDSSTRTLRVDINAGLNNENEQKAYKYSVLNTVAHELTHAAKQGNKYDILREAIISALGTTDKKFSELVDKKFNELKSNGKYKNLTDKELTELADEEVVCDSCETMLQGNTKFFENLYNKDKNLAKKFIEAIKSLIKAIKSYITGSKHADTAYGKALLEVADDLYDQIQQLWNEAVESGLEAAQTQQKNSTTGESGVVYAKDDTDNKSSDRFTDTDYLSAVERGDMETAQRMVDEAARAAGYDMHLYHGSKSGGGFTVFKGWQYFTESKPYAERYTQRDTGKGLYSVFVKSSRLFDTRKPADRALFKQYRNEYGMGDLQESGLPDWTDGYDLSDIIEENDLDYDGIILDEGGDLVNGKPVSRGVSYVIRSSEQIKSADPVTYDDGGKVIPLSERFKTDNADIRYQDRNLIAVHNLSEEKLLKSLKLGGFPMPSIAVTKHDSQHTGFGDISLIFGKDTINPDVNSENKVYGGDAWTPMYPTVEYEADSRKSARLYERAREAVKDGEIEFFNPVSLHPDNIEDRLNRSKGEAGLKADLKKDYGFRNLFLKETTGESVSLKKKESKSVLSQDDIEEYSFLYEQMPQGFDDLQNMSGKDWLAKYGESFRAAREAYIKQFFPDISEEQLDNAIGYEKGFKTVQRARKILDFHENGAETITVQNDIEGTHAEIDSKIDEKAYDKWLDEMLDGIEKNAGIQNGVDPYDSNGYRRSFSATHYAETLGNVVKAMKAQRNGESFFSAAGIFGVAAKNYGTFESMKADTDRLQSLTDEEYDRIKESFGERFAEIAGNIAENGKQLDDNPYINMDICYQNILDGVRESKTKSGLVRYLKKIYGNVIDDSVATDILDLIADVGNMPAKYFEAKPQRAVGLGEVKAAVVPSDTSEEVKIALKNAGIPVHEYEKGNEASRSEATQKAINTEYTNAKGETQSDLRFQDRDYSVEPEDYDDLFDDLFTEDGDLSFGEETDTRRAESFIEKMIDFDAESAAYFLSYSANEIAQNTLNGLRDIELSDSSYLKIAKKLYNNSTSRMGINSETIAERVKRFVMLYDDGMYKSFDEFISSITEWNEQNLRSDRFASPENLLTNAYNLISYIAEEKASYVIKASEMSEKYAKMERASNKNKVEAKQLKAENKKLNRSLSYQEDLTDYYRRNNYNAQSEISKLQMLNKQLEKAKLKAEEQSRRRIERTIERYDKKLDKQKLKAGEQKAAALDRMRTRYEKLLDAEKAKSKDRRRADHDKTVERYEKKIAELKEKSKQQKKAIREDRDTKLIAEKEKRQADLKALRDNRDKKEYVRKIKKVASELQQWVLHPKDRHFVPQEFLRSGFYDAVNEITEALIISDNTKIADRLRTISAGIRKLQNEDEFRYDIDPVIADEMNQLAATIGGKKINRELTLRQAEDIYKSLKIIKDSIVNARKLIFENETKDVVEMGVAVIKEQKALKVVNFNKHLKKLKNLFLTPERMHNIITGYNDNSALNKVFQEIKRGIRKKNDFYMDANKMFDSYRNAHVKELDSSQHNVRAIKWTDSSGTEQTTKMTGMQAMQIVMTWNREAADERLNHLEKGGVSILEPKEFAKGNFQKAYDKRVTVLRLNESFIKSVSKSLTEFERGYIDIAEQFFNVMAKDAINEASLKLKHFETATSDYYIPIKVDEAEIFKEIEGVKFDSSIENMGMLKSIIPYSKKAVLIQGLDSVVNKHIENVGNYYGLAIPIRNMNKLLNVSNVEQDADGKRLSSDSVRHAIESNWGKFGVDIYEQLLTDLQTSRAPKNENFQDIKKITAKLRSNFVTATLNANPSVVLKQAASYSVAGVYLDQSSLAKGSADMLKFLKPGKYQALLDEIDSHTSQHYMRRAGLSSNEIAAIQESWIKTSKLGRNINNSKIMQKLPNGVNPTNWIQEMDCLTTAALWCATKAQVDKEYKQANKKFDTSEYWREVSDLYNKVIEDTQPMYDAMHRPEILKSSSELVKSIFMFKTQPLQNAGIIYDSVGRLIQNKNNKMARKQLRKALFSQGKSLLVFASMSMLIGALMHRMDRYKDEDDELSFGSIMNRFAKDVVQNGTGVIIPLGGSEAAAYITNLIDSNSYLNNDVVSDNIVDTVNKFASSGTNLVQTIGKEFGVDDKGNVNPDWNNIAKSAESFFITWSSDFTGAPVKNSKNIIKGAIDWIKDIADGGGTFEPDVGDMKSNQIVHSYQKHFEKGETDIANERVQEFYNKKLSQAENKGSVSPEKEARNAVRDAFVNYYKKDYQKAFRNNDSAEIERIRKILTSQSKYMKWETKNTPLSEKLREWQKEAAEEKKAAVKK